MRAISWDKFSLDTLAIANTIIEQQQMYDLIICVMRGGCVPGCIISNALNVPMLSMGVKSYADQHQTGKIEVYQSFISDLYNMRSTMVVENVLVVDDLSDTGNTFEYFIDTYQGVFKSIHTAAPYIKTNTSHIPTYYREEFPRSEWIEFPWETSLTRNKYLHAV